MFIIKRLPGDHRLGRSQILGVWIQPWEEASRIHSYPQAYPGH